MTNQQDTVLNTALTFETCSDWICPDLRGYWQLAQVANSDQFVLNAIASQQQHTFSKAEVYALRYFVGQFTVAQVHHACQQKLGLEAEPTLIVSLLQRLLDLGLVAIADSSPTPSPSEPPKAHLASSSSSPWQLKSAVDWIKHHDGYWILRNAEDFTFMQLPLAAKAILDDLVHHPPHVVAEQHHLQIDELRLLLQQLRLTGMLVGTHPPKPPKKKFTPTQLLCFKFSLWNPDPWLSRTLPLIRWIWSRAFAWGLGMFLIVCAGVGLTQHQSILYTGMQLWQALGPSVMLPFGLLTMTVVTLHELGHAYTLKYYGGSVPDVGLMIMCLMPAAYTNTTDQYALTQRYQRALVVAAGLLCQFTIAGIALCLWNLAVPGSWLAATSYLLMVAALVTVALNLNPLARFDGYYLLTALTGINNLRSRSFAFYRYFLLRQSCPEPPSIRWVLALYAPFSVIYLLLVFGHLFLWLSQWIVLNIPFLALILLVLWAIYYYIPNPLTRSPTPNRA